MESQLVGLGVLHFLASAVALAFTLELIGETIRVAKQPEYDLPLDVIANIRALMTATTAFLTWLYCCMGIWLCRRRRLKACRIGAAIMVIVFPFGTILSVLTMIALHRPGVSALFERSAARPV